jgi:hypothetical protein
MEQYFESGRTTGADAEMITIPELTAQALGLIHSNVLRAAREVNLSVPQR